MRPEKYRHPINSNQIVLLSLLLLAAADAINYLSAISLSLDVVS